MGWTSPAPGVSGPLADASAATEHRTAARFMALVTPHVPVVQRVAAALVGTADAEDAAQEALIRAWQAAPSLRGGEPAVRGWLLRIAINVCHDWQRGRFGTRQRLAATLPDADHDAEFAVIADDPGTSDHTGALDLRRELRALDLDLRVVVALRYYAGLDATEIGAVLGAPPATVRTRLRRALGLLRARLEAPPARAGAGERTDRTSGAPTSEQEGGR